MKLLYQTHSPYARKVLVFSHETGLADRITVVHHETSPMIKNEDVFSENPLGKVPVLLRSGQSAIFDSDVICAYLDTLHDGARLLPTGDEERWRALKMQAVAQGMAESGIALRWETVRRPPELRMRALADGCVEKLVAAYDWLESELEARLPMHVGHIAAATALSWLAFRALPEFHQGRPRLSAWFDAFSRRPSMLATPLIGDTIDVPPIGTARGI